MYTIQSPSGITSNGRGVLSMRNPAHDYFFVFFFTHIVQLVGLHVRERLSRGEKVGEQKKKKRKNCVYKKIQMKQCTYITNVHWLNQYRNSNNSSRLKKIFINIIIYLYLYMYVCIYHNKSSHFLNDLSAARTDPLLQILPVSSALLCSGVPATINLARTTRPDQGNCQKVLRPHQRTYG